MSNRFPQLEWITVDGRPTPVPKVQHYKKGSTTETELTGHDNPFPVANYTQNNNGIWMPVSTDNPVPTQLTGSIEEFFTDRNMEIELLAGESYRIVDNVRTDKPYIVVTARPHAKIEMGFRDRTYPTGSFVGSRTLEPVSTSAEWAVYKAEAFTTNFTVEVTNTSSGSVTLSNVTVIGVQW